MLELVDLDRTISKEDYEQVFDELEIRLGECQRAARAAGVPVVIVFEGWDAAGKGMLINRLTQALDPRGFKVHAISQPNEEERLRPWLWRFWTALPKRGSIAIFDRSWYGRVLVERVEKLVPKRLWREAYEDIEEFERQLADNGAVVIKFWLHISPEEQKKRFKRVEGDPALGWKVGEAEWRAHRRYDKWLEAVEEMLERTDTAHAPWTIVEATQGRYARTTVFRTVIGAVSGALARATRQTDAQPARAAEQEESDSTILDRVDLTLTMERKAYRSALKRLQQRLFTLEHELFLARIPAVLVYEGWDAAGKGGSIRRLTRGLDPRGYEVIPTGAPNDEEKAHHYLWRFWRELPKAGHITIFDRSWYGRVLVERVEGFCSEAEWRRAYREINEFERQLTEFGTVLVKFWLHIDVEEQLRRFRSREVTDHKQWKITEEDWRNREKHAAYQGAVVDMLQRTSTTYAPWTIVEANCKLHGRIKAISTVVSALEAGLERGRS